MNDFYTALEIYTVLLKKKKSLSELQKEYDLTDKDINGLERFYRNRERVQDGDGIEDTYIKPERVYGTNIFKTLNSLDILNASLLAKYNEIQTPADEKKTTSPFKDDRIVPVLNKKVLNYKNSDFQRKIYTWIDAVVRKRIVWISLKDDQKIQGKSNLRVEPLGVYCPDGSDRFKIIFQFFKKHEVMEIDMDSIEDKIEVLPDGFEYDDPNFPFSIDTYLSSKRWEKVIIRIYEKERVKNKLKIVFKDRFTVLAETDEYLKVQLEVDEPMKYCELFDSYGRAIAIEKPIELKNEMINRAKNCLAFYDEIVTDAIADY